MPAFDDVRVKRLLWAGIFILLFLSAYVLQPFLLALVMGAIFAVTVLPLHDKIVKKWKWNDLLTSITILFLFVLFVLAPVSFIIVKVISYLLDNPESFTSIATLQGRVSDFSIRVLQYLEVPVNAESIRSGAASLAGTVQSSLTEFGKKTLTNMPNYLLQFAIMLMTMFVFTLRYRRILDSLLYFAGVGEKYVLQMNEVLAEVCHDVVVANILTAVVQATLVALGVLFLTDIDPILIFVLAFVVSFIPVIGAGPLTVAIAGYEFVAGEFVAGGGLLILALIVGVSDNILRAKLVSTRKRSSSFLNILACIGGIYIWGIIGLFIAPLIVSFAYRVVPLLLHDVKRINAKLRSRQWTMLPGELSETGKNATSVRNIQTEGHA